MSANAVKMDENYTRKDPTQTENAVVPINKNRDIREKRRRQNARIKDSKMRCNSCSAILTDAEKLNRTGSYSNFCRRCIERVSVERQRALIDANRLQCKDLADLNRSLCLYNLSSIGSTSEESSNSDESGDEQEGGNLGRKFTKTVGILRRSPRKNKIRCQDESNNENLDAFSQSSDERFEGKPRQK